MAGVGKATAALFAKIGVFTVGDLLQYYPRDFEDRTQKVTLSEYQNFPKVHTIAKVTAHDWFGYGRMKTLKIFINDGTGFAELVAFNRPFLEKALPVGSIVAVTGVFSLKYGNLQSSSFEADRLAFDGDLELYKNSPVPDSKIFPIYRLTEGLSQKIVRKTISAALKQYAFGIEDEIPLEIIKKRGLLKKSDALEKMHEPETMADALDARKTLVYEELFNFQKVIAKNYRGKKDFSTMLDMTSDDCNPERPNGVEESFTNLSPRQKKLIEMLPYDLTADQKKVIATINTEIDKNYGFENQNNSPSTKNHSLHALRALLQGDVGSGKTLVCFFSALRVIDYGGQCAVMAPTEILARQHAENAAKLLSALDVNVAFLTGNLTAKGRGELLKNLKSGAINLVIGTHVLFSKNVEYNDLSLVVIDEQHRFGVLQREAIFNKGRISRSAVEPVEAPRETNLLMMSATPIPQTLALTIFGDLDVLTIKTMPAGRLPVKTHLSREDNAKNAYDAIRSELQKGHQAYFVYPAIEESDGNTNLKAAEKMYEFLAREVYPDFRVALVHGKIDDEEQTRILREFSERKIDVLVATTVVEVGVDNPNATCIAIEQAERFGLSALHQLRGRVGRGTAQSHCFLIYSKNITENGKARMKALFETTDGFKIAEEDLRLRGPGEISGTAQSGDLEFALADLSRDIDLLYQAREDAFSFASAGASICSVSLP